MQVGHHTKEEQSEYELITNNGTNQDDINKLISDAAFPADYDAFNDENLDMIP